jgi:hypothetical protein
MTRSVTGLCVAAAFGFAVTLAAQAPANQQYGKSGDKDKGHEMTVTGCLSKAPDGNFMLTNARAESKPSTTTGTAGTTTAPPTGGSTPTSSMANAMTWKLEGGTDLDKHIGHKVEVTGHTDWAGAMDRGRNPGDTTASATTTTDPAHPQPTTTTAGTTTPVGTSGTTADDQRYKGSRDTNQPKLEVTSVKMISSSCQ